MHSSKNAKVKVKEKSFETTVKKFLRDRGCYVIKNFGCSFTRAGLPDLVVCANGKFIALELKNEKGKATPLQLANIRDIQGAGGVALILRPQDFDKFKSYIEQITGQ